MAAACIDPSGGFRLAMISEHTPYVPVMFTNRPNGLGWHGNALLIRRGIDGGKISVVINGVDLPRYAPRPRDAELEAAWSLGGKFVIGQLQCVDDADVDRDLATCHAPRVDLL